MNLQNHIEVLSITDLGDEATKLPEKDLIHQVTIRILDSEFSSVESIPPWKVVVVALSSQADAQDQYTQRLFILFAYYHSHGDGKSALAFHRTFLQGLNGHKGNLSEGFTCETPSTPLPPTIEQAGKLSISWAYLLSPLFGAYLPDFVATPLGLRASTTPKSADAWKGDKPPFDHSKFTTGLEFFNIPYTTTDKTLRLCRTHDVKFTSLLHQLVVRALREALPNNTSTGDHIGSFVALTVVDIRHLLNGVGSEDMSCPGPTASFELFRRHDDDYWKDWTNSESSSPIWTAARQTTKDLAKCASTLHNQPIGLLSYLSKFRPWMQGEAAKDRDSSYEISIFGVFDPTANAQKGEWDIESMFFAQPANVMGSCLAVNVITKKGGDTTISLTWQEGTLDVNKEQDFVSLVCQLLQKYFSQVA